MQICNILCNRCRSGETCTPDASDCQPAIALILDLIVTVLCRWPQARVSSKHRRVLQSRADALSPRTQLADRPEVCAHDVQLYVSTLNVGFDTFHSNQIRRMMSDLMEHAAFGSPTCRSVPFVRLVDSCWTDNDVAIYSCEYDHTLCKLGWHGLDDVSRCWTAVIVTVTVARQRQAEHHELPLPWRHRKPHTVAAPSAHLLDSIPIEPCTIHHGTSADSLLTLYTQQNAMIQLLQWRSTTRGSTTANQCSERNLTTTTP